MLKLMRKSRKTIACILTLAIALGTWIPFFSGQASAAVEVPQPDILNVDYSAGGPVDHVKGRAVTKVGTPTYALDPTLKVYTGTYDGTSSTDAVDVADAYTGSPNVISSFTAECVFKWNGEFSPTSTQNVCSGRDSGGFGFFAQNGKKSITFAAYINATQVILPYPAEALISGAWYDAVGTFDGQFLRLYLNGALASESKVAGTLTPPKIVNSGKAVVPKWDLGADWTPVAAGPYDAGAPVTIAASRMWSKALTAQQVVGLADTTFGGRDSGVAFGSTVPAQGAHLSTAVIFNPAIVNQGNAFNWSFLLDGARIQLGQYIGGGLAAGSHTIAISATDVFGTPISYEIHFTSDDVPVTGSSGTGQADGKVKLSAVATDPSEGDVTVTFRRADVQVAEGGFQGVVPAVPTSLEFAYAEGATVEGTMTPDGETFDSPSTGDIPFQRFDVAVSGTQSSRRVTWSGVVDPARTVSLQVWNTATSAWEVVGSGRGATDGNTELSGAVGEQHIDDSVSPAAVHVLVLAKDPFADDLSDRTPAAAADKDHFGTPTDDPEDGTPGKYQFSFVHWTDPQYIAAGAARVYDPSVGGVSLPNVGALTTWPHVEGATESLDEASVWAAAYEGALNWTADNAESKRIAWAAMTGDITQNYNYDNKATDSRGNPLYPGAAEQFKAELAYTHESFSVMDSAGIPYQVVAGNHDNLNGSDDVPFAETFSAAGFYDKAGDWGTDWVTGASYHTMDEDPQVTGTPSGSGPDGRGVNSENSYELFSAGGLDFVSVGLAYGVTAQEAEWARKVFAKYHDRNGILTTHGYLAASASSDGRGSPFSNDGSALYNAVVVPNPNVFLVLAGHVHGVATNLKSDIGVTVDTKHNVVEMLADYQNYRMAATRVFTAERCAELDIPCRWGTLDGKTAVDVDDDGQYDHYGTDELWFGASFLRLLQFNTKQSTMSVDTYSPFFDEFGNYPNDNEKRYDASADNLTIPVDLTTRKTSFGTDSLVLSTPTDTLIGDPVTVPSGAVASVEWTRLVPGQLYSWTASTSGGAEFGGLFVATEAGAGPGWQAPVLSVPDDVTIDEGQPFDPMQGVQATDDLDGDLTSSVVVTGWPGGTPEPGDYELTYSVSDSWDNQTQAARTVTVTPLPELIKTSLSADDVQVMSSDDSATFTATIEPSDATGTVQFLINDEDIVCEATIESGIAICTIELLRLAPGTHTLVAIYSGDATHDWSYGTFKLKVAGEPVGLTATAGDEQVDLAWNTVTGATHYEIYEGIASGAYGATPIESVTGATYAVTGLTNGTTYYFNVKAVNEDGAVVYHFNEVSAMPQATLLPGDTEAPSWPERSKVEATDVRRNQVTLSWTAAEDKTGVEAYRITRGDGEPVTISASKRTTTITGLTSGTNYSFKVEAGDAAGNWSTDGPSASVRTDSSGGGGSHNSNPSIPSGDTPTAKVSMVDGMAVVELSEGQTTVDVSVADIQDGSLQVKMGMATMTIDPELLDALLAQASHDPKAVVRVKIKPIDTPSAQTSKGQTHVTVAGQAYDLCVALITTDGREIVIDTVDGGVYITLPYDAVGIDENLLGVYYYNEETDDWEYVGGEIDRSANEVTVQLQHLSTYAVLEYNQTFSDVPSTHWVARTLQILAAKHLIQGTNDTAFSPDAKTTRAEFTTLLVRGLGLTATDKSTPFSDINSDAWYAADVAAAYEAGMVTGVTADTFDPNAEITREQMAALLVRAYEYKYGHRIAASGDIQNFQDGESVSAWARDEMSKAIAAGLVQGKGSGFLDPQSDTLRAEAAQAIFNVFVK